MGKAINGLVNRSEESHDNRNVTRITVVDVLHPKGSRDRAVINEKKRDPHTMVVTKIREVTYLYNNDVTSSGFEIVEEVSISKSEAPDTNFVPKVVGSVVRDLRFVEPLKPKRFED